MVPVNFSDIADQVRAGVVNIQVSKKVSNAEFPNFRGNPFGRAESLRGIFRTLRGQPAREKTAGSGFRMHHQQGRIHPDQ